jgi:hypothetical protein
MVDIKARYNKNIFCDSKQLLDDGIYKFLFILIKDIFLCKVGMVTKDTMIKEKLEEWIKKINEEIIKDKSKYINREYNIDNLNNIINFVKMQNAIFASEIIENILIKVFGFAFKTDKVNTFGKYIYNNIKKMREGNNDLAQWFQPDLLRNELKDIENILSDDVSLHDALENKLNSVQKQNVFYNFLLKLKLEQLSNSKFKSSKKVINFLNQGDDILNKTEKTVLDSSITKTYYTNIYSCNFFSGELGKGNKSPISLARSFFISVYIYYQNKESPLMNYIKESEDKKDLAVIPFSYDLTGAIIESPFTGIIMAPARIEPRITELLMVQNILQGKGLFELSKVLLFNRNIKIVNLQTCALKSRFLNPFNNGMGLFDNFTVEEVNISLNYIKEDCREYLATILSHLKGLKTINLSGNDLKGGVSSFIIMLNNLYRKKQICLENLVLSKCILDDISFYELGELLKSPYCKLKNLYLNINNIPSNVNFLKKLKKNKSLTEIYFNKSNIGNNDTDDIMRIMSNTNLEYLYLYKNRLNDFDDCLRMLYRTKLVVTKDEEEKKEKKIMDSCLYNIDLSNNDYLSKSIEQIELLRKIIEKTTLYSLDLSHILFGVDPNRILKQYEKDPNSLNDYQKKVFDLKKKLDDEQTLYTKIIGDINSNKADKEKYEEKLKINNLFEHSKPIDDEINDIVKDSNSKYPIFLKEKAKRIIKNNTAFFEKDENFQKLEFKKKEQKIVEYMSYKRSENDLKNLMEKKREKKLIII